MSLMKSDTDASLSRGTTEQGHSRGHKPGLRDVRPVLVPQPAQQISQDSQENTANAEKHSRMDANALRYIWGARGGKDFSFRS